MGDAGTIDLATLTPSPLILADDDLAIFVLNVGDGDSIVIRFPRSAGSTYAVVDSNRGPKTVNLINALGRGTIAIMCATHPHLDHVRGLREVLRTFDVREYWDSGFRYASKTYEALIEEVEDQARRHGLVFMRPTSGYERYHAGVRITVLSPSVQLKNRYDTYGVPVNNASIVLRLSYPTTPVGLDYPGTHEDRRDIVNSRTAILSGDAQTDAWARVLEEFPHLYRDTGNWARAIRGGGGIQPLYCDFFKVPHHLSKRGINFETLERLGDRYGGGPVLAPKYLAVSCAGGTASNHGFPHRVSHELLREAREPIATKGGDHLDDVALGIHLTAQGLAGSADGEVAGSIAFVAAADRTTRLYRFLDAPHENVDLARARLAPAPS